MTGVICPDCSPTPERLVPIRSREVDGKLACWPCPACSGRGWVLRIVQTGPAVRCA